MELVQVTRTAVGSTQTIETCDECKGAGLVPTLFAEMKVAVCGGCNGYGKVIVHEWIESNLGEVVRRVSYAGQQINKPIVH